MFLNGDAAGLMKEFNKVDRQVARWSSSWTKPGAKLALGFLGVHNALTAVSGEIRNVVQNIEGIPGVPAETVASIITMRENLAGAKNWIDRMTAGVVAFGVQAAQAIGVTAAGMMGFQDAGSLSQQETPDQIARAKDPGFDDKMAAASRKLAEARKAASLAGAEDVQQIIELRKEAERYETFAKSSSINTVQRLEAQTSAQEKLTQAAAKMADLQKQLAEAEKATGKALDDKILAGSLSTPQGKLEDLRRAQGLLQNKLGTLQSGDQSDPANIKSQIALNEQLAAIYQRQVPFLEKQNALAKEAGNTIASSFEDAVFQGTKFSDMLKGIAIDMARLIFRQNITGPLALGSASLFKGLFGSPAADGGYRDGSRPYLVGENGPEIFNPGQGGTIIPNHAIASAPSGSGGDTFAFTYNFASGVTRQEVAGLIPSIVRASAGLVADKMQRGGAYRRALA